MSNDQEIDKYRFKSNESNYQTEINMTGLDYERLNNILQAVDELSIRARLLDIYFLDRYYSVLKTFYLNLTPLLKQEIKFEYDSRFEDIENLKEKCHVIYDKYLKRIQSGDSNAKIELESFKIYFSFLEVIHRLLLTSKQRLGMGFWTSKKPQLGNLLTQKIVRT